MIAYYLERGKYQFFTTNSKPLSVRFPLKVIYSVTVAQWNLTCLEMWQTSKYHISSAGNFQTRFAYS